MKGPIVPCLWFDPDKAGAAEAAAFYCEHFKDARITAESPVVTEFVASGQRFICLNGGPQYRPNPSISFYYICETEAEHDALWSAFEKEGEVMVPVDRYPWSGKYGWIQDKFGVSWQIALGKISEVGQRITPSLLFVGDQCGRAEEAIEHYASVFHGFKLDGIARYDANQPPEKEGTVQHAQFALDGQKFMAMDSADTHNFTFSEGISFTIYCETQDDIDHYWNKLTEGGQESMCGWLKDRFGVSWQVIPTMLGKLMSDPDKAPKAAEAFMQMKKFNIEQLIRATL